MTDWRWDNLGKQPYLRAVEFSWRAYRAFAPDWDHDHCAACGVKLAEAGSQGADTIHEGYATTEKYAGGAEYEWVCRPCFELFAARMGWTAV